MRSHPKTWIGIGLAVTLLPAAGCFDEQAVQDEASQLYEACVRREEHEALLARVQALEQAGFLLEETDPLYGASVAAGVASADLARWDEAHGWGDHGAAGYLEAESDPVYSGSAAATVTAGDLADWDEAVSWGDHAGIGYATTVELDSAVAALERCPPGYLQDATETRFVLCYHPDSNPSAPDEMVQVGDFWVDRYEASVWSDPDCTGTQYGASGDGYVADFPDTGSWDSQLFACSAAGVLPSRYLTWFQAQQACAASGKNLCSNDRWQAAAAGTWDPGSNDGIFGGACNTDSVAPDPRATGLAGATPSGQDSCVSAWGAEDMVGNAWEWVADWQVAGPNGLTSDGDWSEPWPVDFGDDRTWHLGGSANTNSGYVDGLPAATIRGGSSDSGTSAGQFALDLRDAPTFFTDAIGFRCCR